MLSGIGAVDSIAMLVVVASRREGGQKESGKEDTLSSEVRYPVIMVSLER
jgi:hypothetical protein